MTRREHRAATRLALGRYCPPWLRYAYREQRSITPHTVKDPLAERVDLRASAPHVPTLHPLGDHVAWTRLWLALDRRRCPARPEHERHAYARRIVEAERGFRF